MKRVVIAFGVLVLLAGTAPCEAAELAAEKAQVRKERRKVEEKVQEAREIGEQQKDVGRLEAADLGEASRISDAKLESQRLDYALAARLRAVFKADKGKEVERDLTAVTEAEEAKARAAEARQRAEAEKKKRKVDLTLLFDW